MKSVSHQMRYPGATPEQVYAMLSQPDFRDRVCEFQRFPRRSVDIVAHGDGSMSVTVDQHRPTHEVPGFARKIVGDEINIVQREEWSSPTRAELVVEVPGKPGTMKGTVELVGDAEGTTETVAVEVAVHIPLVGGKIEGLLAEMLIKALKAENKVGKDWLAGA